MGKLNFRCQFAILSSLRKFHAHKNNTVYNILMDAY